LWKPCESKPVQTGAIILQLVAKCVYSMQDRPLSIAKNTSEREFRKFPAALLIQVRRVTSSTIEVKCPNWMIKKSVIAFCDKNTPTKQTAWFCM